MGHTNLEMVIRHYARWQRKPERVGTLAHQLSGRVAPEDCAPEAPTDPDVQIFRIRLFGPRLRYATMAGRMRGSGSG
jgi:hypothetical protein